MKSELLGYKNHYFGDMGIFVKTRCPTGGKKYCGNRSTRGFVRSFDDIMFDDIMRDHERSKLCEF